MTPAQQDELQVMWDYAALIDDADSTWTPLETRRVRLG